MDLSLMISTFGVILVAELGDKTQLAVIMQTCKYRSPWPVFLGGSLALTAVTALGVVGGHLLGAMLPRTFIRVAASAAFAVMGILIWRESRKVEPFPSAVAAACDVEPGTAQTAAGSPVWNWKAFNATSALLFLAELGDKTQLAVLGLSSSAASPLAIFVGGASALTVVTGLGVLGGQQLCRMIPQRRLLQISAGLFILLACLMGLGII